MLTLADLTQILMPEREIAGAQQVSICEVCIDSRVASDGALFVALMGENTDGHRYVRQAFDAGARVALVERPIVNGCVIDLVASQYPDRVEAPVEVIVPDALAALQALAAGLRAGRDDLRVVGITGSVGKTTTKEAVAAVLAARHSTLKSAGNFNNEIGLPLTLVRLAPEHRYAVLEMGMYALGEITDLCEIARPDVGVVTNVYPVHLERLGTIECIARAKSELVRALPADGLAVLNGDDPRVRAMIDLTEARVVTYGCGDDNTVTARDIAAHGLEGVSFTTHLAASARFDECRAAFPIRLRMLGEHAVMAALPGIAVGLAEGLAWEEIAAGLWQQGSGPRLMSVAGLRGSTLLDDCYNASPSSTCAALDLLGSLPGRRIAVLGDMLELGDAESRAHRRVGEHCARTVDLVIAVGPRARGIAEGALAANMAPSSVYAVDSNQEAIGLLVARVGGDDTVLVKGSRGMAMEGIVSALKRETDEEAP